MLEQQHTMLVSAVRKLYRRIVVGESWPGDVLHEESDGQPLTRDILDRLTPYCDR